MCDYSTKLVAWLDNELELTEMAQVQAHLQDCGECRDRVAKYRQISQAFDAYCDGVTSAAPNLNPHRWVPILSAAAALLLLVAGATLVLRNHVQKLPPLPVAVVRPPQAPVVSERAAAPNKPMHLHKNAAQPTRVRPANWSPSPPQLALEVAIPADSMFPPGAIPEGVNFVADVNFAPDGSARQMRLRPRLTAVERSASQP